jgi:hypothetical protein
MWKFHLISAALTALNRKKKQLCVILLELILFKGLT